MLVSVCIVCPPPPTLHPTGKLRHGGPGGGLSCADPQTTAALGLGVGRAWGHPLWSASGGGGARWGGGFKVLLQVPRCLWGAARSPPQPVANAGHLGL